VAKANSTLFVLYENNSYSGAEIMVNTVHVIFVSAKRRKEAMPGASLTDDNAVMAEIASAVFTVISAMLY